MRLGRPEDDGYIELAYEILKGIVSEYEYLLKKYRQTEERKYLYRILNVEKLIRSNYFLILSRGQVDADEFIRWQRKKYGVVIV